MIDVADPKLDPHKLSIEDKIELVKQSNGLLVDILPNKVDGGLYLGGCTSLTHLPDGLKVRNLDLRGCTSLTHLPDGLKVDGYLDLRGCTSLTHLPDGLKVSGDLNLWGCTSLTHLPDGLKVDGDLNLRGCTGLYHYKKKPKAKWRQGIKGKIIWE